MSEWKETTIGEIVTLIGGGTPKTKKEEYWNGDIPWLSVVDFNNGRKFVYDTEKKITSLGLENSSTKLLKKGDVIISARGTVGVVAMLGKPMAFNQSCYGVRGTDETTNEFIYYLLIERVSNFIQYAHGGVFNTITRNTFNEIHISLPPLPEQRAIAEVLSSLDDKIDLLHRQNKILEKMAETLFRQWFVHRPEPVEGEEVDEEWEEGVLGDVLKFNYGKSLPKRKRSGIGYPVYGSSGITDFHTDFLVEGPGIVTGRKGTLGVIMYSFESFYPIDTTFYITNNRKRSNLLFDYFLLKQLNLADMNTDSAVPGLNRGNAESIEISIPPVKLITEFESFIEPKFSKIKSNQTQIHTLIALRDTLLPKLMSREVRVNE